MRGGGIRIEAKAYAHERLHRDCMKTALSPCIINNELGSLTTKDSNSAIILFFFKSRSCIK